MPRARTLIALALVALAWSVCATESVATPEAAVSTDADSDDPGLVGPAVVALTIAFLAYWFFLRDATPVRATAVPTFQPVQRAAGSSSGAGGKSLEALARAGRNLFIVYGTQSGTAEEFSNRLAQASRRYALSPFVTDVEELDRDSLASLADFPAVVVFVFATYGEGEPTDSAVDFFEWITEHAPDAALAGVRYTVFGLGDRTYEHYQFIGRAIDKHAKRLGGRQVFRRGEGDDNGQQEEDFMSWQEELWPALVAELGIDTSKADQTLARSYALKVHTPEQLAAAQEIEARRRERVRIFDQKNLYRAPIVVNDELHGARSDRSCRHVALSIGGSSIRYAAGDHVGLFPFNDPALVDALGARLGVDLNLAVSLEPTESGPRQPPFPGPCTVRTALARYCDITTPPSKYMLQSLAEFATDPTERAALVELASNASAAARERYHEFVQRAERHVLAVLDAFPSVRPELGAFLEMLPKLNPRYYSISSSPRVHKDQIHVTAVVLRYTSPAGLERRGVCTNWLASLATAPSPSVEIFVRASKFRLPTNTSDAVIMIGPGTGVAPFRGFVHERAADRAAGKTVGPTVLFFGCRDRDVDFLYEPELRAAEASGALTHLFVAFSRPAAASGAKKAYVQELIREQGALVWSLLSTNNASLYICGDAKAMAVGVRAALEDTIRAEAGITIEEAREFLETLAKGHRLQLDVW